MKINIMSPKLTNMIAAGEVVERPLDVIKELVENAIDAAASKIDIYLKEAGIKEIKVIDDGCGMEKDDVKLAFMPHATSKIHNEYELFRVKTLGFRGEAISSIASISTMMISSREKNSLEGYEVTYKYGKKINEGLTSLNVGTTVLVRDLFLNTPVRLKFLKLPAKELQATIFMINKLAFSNPHIKFSLFNDDKEIFRSDGKGDVKTIFGAIYGYQVAKIVNHVTFNYPGFKGDIYYLKPSEYRSNKLHITLIINGRYVKNVCLQETLIKTFDGYLPINKYPILTLYLNIDPLLIDVNIHPRKAEIKIADEQVIAFKIAGSLRSSLISLNHLEAIKEENKEVKKEVNYTPKVDDFFTSYNKYSFKETNIDYNLFKNDEEPSYKKIPDLNIVGVIFKTYILATNNYDLYLIDQHAACERVNYEKYLKLLNENKGHTSLLVPFPLFLSNDEKMLVDNNLNLFEKLNFNFNSNYELIAIPLWAKELDLKTLIVTILNDILKENNLNIINYREEIAKQISCKASIRAHDSVSELEIVELVKELNKCENPYHCPHGRPTIIKFSKQELEEMFERIQK